MLSQFLQFPFLNLEHTIANEKKEYSKILYVNGEVDFGLRYDLQVKLNKKLINTLTITITAKPLSQNLGLTMDS